MVRGEELIHIEFHRKLTGTLYCKPMPQRNSKLTQFWQELKRRRVLHVITVYASSAFVIIELINNLAEPLNLPSNLLIIAVIVLAVGFPLVAILSWLYDLTGQGMERTKPLSETGESEKTVVPNAWKFATYISFAVILGLVAFNLAGRTGKLRPGDIHSLMIFPFDNFTGDDQLDYVAAGMHSALIGDMGQVSALRVISQTTASVYKEKEMSLPEIAKETHIGAVIEPSVLCYGDSVCIQIRVIATYPEEKQLYVAEYKEDKSQILNLYSKITKEIAEDLKVELTPREEELLARKRTVDRDAYDAYLKSSQLLGDAGPESLYKARDYLNSAIEKDPEWAPLYLGLTTVWATMVQLGVEPPEIGIPKTIENLNKAIELDQDYDEANGAMAMVAFLQEWDWEKAEKEYLQALAINPSNGGRIIYSHLLACLQRPDEAVTQGKLALALDPLNPMFKVWYAATLQSVGKYEEALALEEEVTAEDPGHYLANCALENSAFSCGDYDKVMEALKYLLPARNINFEEIEIIYTEKGIVAAYEEILRREEVTAKHEYVPPMDMALRYMMVGQKEKAMEWIEKGYELRDQNMPYIATHSCLCEPLFDDPRFINIVQKMNLPLPPSD
jgi:TolB-like protein